MVREILRNMFHKEQQPLHTIGNLWIIVHPFNAHHYQTENFSFFNKSGYIDTAQKQKELLLQRSIPKYESDVTIIIPATPITPQGEWDNEARGREEQSFIAHPEIPTWKGLYDTLRAASAYGQNVILQKDFILRPNTPHSVQTMRTSLKKNHSMIITSATNITLSGEDEPACVLGVGEQLLRYRDIATFNIDKATSIASDGYLVSNEERFSQLQQPTIDGCIITDTGDYFQITKGKNFHIRNALRKPR